MLEPRMTIACTLYKAVANEYGDLRRINPISTTCWFRDIRNLEHSTDRDTGTAQSMAWFRPGTDIAEGDWLVIDSVGYQINSVTFARRLGSPAVQFIKCTLGRQEATVS